MTTRAVTERQAAGRRPRRAELEAAVAYALRHLHDPIALAVNSPLVEWPMARQRMKGRRLFDEGIALQECLIEALQPLVDSLQGGGKIGRLREALTGVMQGKSITRLSKETGVSRTWYSKSTWRDAVALATSAIVELDERSRVSTR